MCVKEPGSKHQHESSSAESTPPPSRPSSRSDLNKMASPSISNKTLASRSKVPFSMYIIAFVIFGSQNSGGVYTSEVFQSVIHSLKTSAVALATYCEYLRDLTKAVATGRTTEPHEVITSAFATAFASAVLYILLYIPFRAGMWTGQRARRHKVHRYMGLSFLILYFAAWIEFFANYENGGKDSYLAHFISLNGVVQSTSAYFTFKVLPELADPGYYSDKAVLSRRFIHENTYFGTVCFVGSLLYHDKIRSTMMVHPLGRVILLVFVYWPYVVVRPFFPTTRFSNAGSSMSGRSAKNEAFYRVGTLLVKVFYLWGKYILGFYLNWVCYLSLGSDNDMKVIRGIYLMNMGTVSISVFLHTLRFKKQLPPTLSFSLYLSQIYGTFLALPYCYDLFFGHKRLLFLAASGLLINLTRNRVFHVCWCGVCMYLMEFSDVQW